MEEKIYVSDHEPAYEWLNKLAKEAPEGKLWPEEYSDNEVEDLAQRMAESVIDRRDELNSETMLSEREAEVVGVKEENLTHNAIALVMSLTGETRTVTSSTVDEYVRRARGKYHKASVTCEHLHGEFGTKEIPLTW